MNRTGELIYWITEREAMRHRKEDVASLPSWAHGYSDDPYMGAVRYCNVFREDDKVTRWLAEHWRTADMPVWWMVLGRMVNYIPTLEAVQLEMGYSTATKAHSFPDLPTIEAIIKQRREQGEKVWTSAYTISTAGQRVDKVNYVLGVVGASGKINASWSSLEAAHRGLRGVMGLGSFLAAQVVADLKNTAGWGLGATSTPDWWTWSAHGPGSLKGLSEYFRQPVTPAGYPQAISKVWEEIKDSVPMMHMQDLQNCMCEFSKYIRIKEGRGHARNKYSPTR